MNGKPEKTVSFEMVSPETALIYLQSNSPLQRKISRVKVEDYKGDMNAGLWALNGQTISFDWDGHLVDGQHRLTAIVETGKTVEMIVVRNLDPAVFETIDQGRARSLSTVLQTNGEVSSVARSLSSYAAKGSLAAVLSQGGKLTAPRVSEWFAANRAEVEEIAHMTRRVRKSIGRVSTIALAAPLYALRLQGVDIEAFVDDLCGAYTPDASARACVWAKAMSGVNGSGHDARVKTAKLVLWLGECFRLGVEPARDRSKSVDLVRYDIKED